MTETYANCTCPPALPRRTANDSPLPTTGPPGVAAFLDGYLAGITHGLGLGRAQGDQEHTDANTFPDQGTIPLLDQQIGQPVRGRPVAGIGALTQLVHAPARPAHPPTGTAHSSPVSAR
jgi:hypothetical protein